MARGTRRLLMALLLAVPVIGPRAPATAGERLCTQTSRATAKACSNGVRDDYWIAVGTCANLADPGARKTCRHDAKASVKDAADECRAQFDAREDLCGELGQDAYDPAVDPARYLAPAQIAAKPNPYFPLVPGNTWTYAGAEHNVVTVTHDVRTILGVSCIVVHDVVDENGVVVEDTEDYFAQDVDGNVWYFGELSKSLENGQLVDLHGSWTAGVDGAKPGILMKATPMAGETYRQEFALGTAEDAAQVVATTASATVPAVSCSGTCVQTLDFSPLEPDAQEHKFYAPGTGLILEIDLETGERLELNAFTPG